MKKIIFLVFVTIFTLSASMVFGIKSDRNSNMEKSAIPVKSENKLSDKEIDRMTRRVKEIRNMDKSDLTAEEKGELKSELKGMKENVKNAGGTVYIGGASLLLIIILIIILI